MSEYVARYFVCNCKYEKLETFLQLHAVECNPAFEGWVAELSFLIYLRAAKRNKKGMQLWEDPKKQGTPEEWSVKSLDDDVDFDNLIEAPKGEWLIPRRWNPGGYDFIQLIKEEKLLRVIQVTRLQSHGFNLVHVITLLKNLDAVGINIKCLDIVLAYPTDRDIPEIGEVFSDKRSEISSHVNYKSGENWECDHIRKLSFDYCALL